VNRSKGTLALQGGEEASLDRIDVRKRTEVSLEAEGNPAFSMKDVCLPAPENLCDDQI